MKTAMIPKIARKALPPRIYEPSIVRRVNNSTATANNDHPTPATPVLLARRPAIIKITEIRKSSDCQ